MSTRDNCPKISIRPEDVVSILRAVDLSAAILIRLAAMFAEVLLSGTKADQKLRIYISDGVLPIAPLSKTKVTVTNRRHPLRLHWTEEEGEEDGR